MPSASDPFATYLAAIQIDYQAGRATEHTHRPALKQLIEALAPGTRATNEPKRIECGAPDYIITRPSGHGPLTLGYIEAKDIGARLDDIERDAGRAEPATREGQQLKRYLRALPNLLFTDYVEFRWYTDGNRRQIARLADVGAGNKLTKQQSGVQETASLLDNFLKHNPEPITKPQDLALRMARLTHIIMDIIIEAYERNQASNLLWG